MCRIIFKGVSKMKNITNLLVFGVILVSLSFACQTKGTHIPYGTTAAAKVSDEELTLSKMLIFALQDEYLARGEYRKIIEEFGNRRPFSNIVRAEGKHVSMLLPLFKKYKVQIPADRGMELAILPATYSETFQIGVDAEIANIAMYERFLKKDLPIDVRGAFNRLLSGSKRHLIAFKRQVKRN